MARETDDLTARVLREIQATLAEHGRKLDKLDARMVSHEKQYDSISKLVTYSLGQSSETQFKQNQEAKRIDELAQQLGQLLDGRTDGFSESKAKPFEHDVRHSGRPEQPALPDSLIERVAKLPPEELERQMAEAAAILLAEEAGEDKR